ncbi:MAG: class I SAM-dependent methyltransferase [Chthoniobacterales bacterium]
MLEIGSMNVNGSLRDVSPSGVRYTGVDMAAGPGVDHVVSAGSPLPFPDASFDVAMTSSTFEHDVCFWESFVECLRVLRPGGFLYVNAPSNHGVHRYPLDCWRFYPDAGIALVAWAKRKGVDADLVESFVADPLNESWADFVAVFRRSSSSPWISRGRIADATRAVNIHDGGQGDPPPIERESWATYDMRQADLLTSKLETAEQRVEQLQAALAKLSAGGNSIAVKWLRRLFSRRESLGQARRPVVRFPGPTWSRTRASPRRA